MKHVLDFLHWLHSLSQCLDDHLHALIYFYWDQNNNDQRKQLESFDRWKIDRISARERERERITGRMGLIPREALKPTEDKKRNSKAHTGCEQNQTWWQRKSMNQNKIEEYMCTNVRIRNERPSTRVRFCRYDRSVLKITERFYLAKWTEEKRKWNLHSVAWLGKMISIVGRRYVFDCSEWVHFGWGEEFPS